MKTVMLAMGCKNELTIALVYLLTGLTALGIVIFIKEMITRRQNNK